MSDPRPPDEHAALRQLLGLAQDRSRSSQRALVDNITDLFITTEGRLTERERQLIGEILQKLVRELEHDVRRRLAERFAVIPGAPVDLMVMLANDQIEVARPILQGSPVLRDPDLIEVVKHRTREHLLAVAMRAPLGPDVSDAIVERGDEIAIEALLRNTDAAMSQRSLEYLVAESERIDRFQEPLVRRADLPPRLAARMFWWVSAALRQAIVNGFAVNPALVDDIVEETTRAAIADSRMQAMDEAARRLIEEMVGTQTLDERFLLQALRSGRVAAFVAAIAKLARLDPRVVRRIVFEPGGQSLAMVCKAIGLERSAVSNILLLAQRGMVDVVSPEHVAGMMAFYDSLDRVRTRAVLQYWRADAEYLIARQMLEPAVAPAARDERAGGETGVVRNAEDITPPARARDIVDVLGALAPLDAQGEAHGWLDTPIERALTRVVLEDFAPLAVVRVDDGAAFVNKTYLKLYGLTREDERLASHRAQLADEVGAALARLRENAALGSETIVVERKLAIDGGRNYRVHYLPIFDSRQRLAACVVLYYDVSSETAALDRLRGVQTLFRDVLRSASDWVWETDAGGLLTFISDRIAQVAGVPPTLLIGRPLTALGNGYDDGRLAQVIEARQPFRGFVLDVRDREGRPRRHQLSGVPFFEEGGRFIGFRGTGTDVSAQHAAELASRESRRKLEETLSELHQQNQRLDTALERAQAAARSKGEFLANMSHELRTPLNAIIGFADIISGQSFGADPARYADYAGDILKAGRHLLRIVDDVLEYSRREQTALAVVTHAVHLGDIVEEAHAYVYEAARRRGIELTIVGAAEPLSAVVDRTRALQIVINLMSNAVKFTPAGGKVGAEIAAQGGAVAVTVWDTGPGIALDQQERVFEPFYQVHDEAYSRPHEGVGLGLAIARRLARMMGGDVTLESVPGAGARFTARFPRAAVPREGTST